MWPDERPLRRRLLPVALLTLLSTFNAQLVSGATVSWVGGSGDWNTPANWSAGAPPGPDDDVVIDRPGEITVTHASGAHAVKSVLCQEAFTLSDGSLTVSNTIQVNNTFRVSGGALARATVLQGTNGLGITATGGTLDGVSLASDVTIPSGYELNLAEGMTLLGGAKILLEGAAFSTALQVNPGALTIGAWVRSSSRAASVNCVWDVSGRLR